MKLNPLYTRDKHKIIQFHALNYKWHEGFRVGLTVGAIGATVFVLLVLRFLP